MTNKTETFANVEDVGQPKREASLAAPTGYAALYDAAKKASEQWSPFTQNHDPAFIAALRDAYCQGYVSGAYVTDRDGSARHSAPHQPRAERT